MLIHRVPFLVGLIVLALYVSVKHAYAESPAFHQNITVGKDGAPTLQLTNDSELSITAFVMVEFPSLGMEGRTYYDVYTNSGEQAIPSGASITKGLSHFQGAERRVRAEVRAVIFKDGSTAGDPVWVNAVLVRRLRMHDRLLSLHDLLRPLVGTGASRESMLEVLSSHLAETDKQPEDDLRLMDDAVFHGAISTFDRNREAPADAVLKAYLKYLENGTLILEYSRPSLDIIRNLPVAVPKPLSDAGYSADERERLAQWNGVPGSPSSCTAEVPFTESAEPSLSCTDSDGDTVTQSNTYTFSVKFSQYNGSTGKTTNGLPWSSAGQGPFNGVGVCYKFNDCENQPDVYWKQGLAFGEGAALPGILPGSPSLTATQGGNSVLFYWFLDRYQSPPTFTQCDQCDLCPTCGENPTSSDPQVPTTYWYFNYACTVT